MSDTKHLCPLENFFSEEVGTVSVDWVVLSGAVVGLGLATSAAMTSASTAWVVSLDDLVKQNIGLSPWGTVISANYSSTMVSGGGSPEDFVNVDYYEVQTSTGETLLYGTGILYGQPATIWRDANGNDIPEEDWPDLPDGIIS